MDVSKFANLNEVIGKVGGLQPPATPSADHSGLGVGGPSFEETLKGLTTSPAGAVGNAPGVSPGELVFSKHAVERMRSRGINMGPTQMQRLETAFDKATGKGSKSTLVLMDDNAFIMSVKNKTIVTAMDQSALKENLFTNIDSTIIV